VLNERPFKPERLTGKQEEHRNAYLPAAHHDWRMLLEPTIDKSEVAGVQELQDGRKLSPGTESGVDC
jgi:hypothetical protein